MFPGQNLSLPKHHSLKQNLAAKSYLNVRSHAARFKLHTSQISERWKSTKNVDYIWVFLKQICGKMEGIIWNKYTTNKQNVREIINLYFQSHHVWKAEIPEVQHLYRHYWAAQKSSTEDCWRLPRNLSELHKGYTKKGWKWIERQFSLSLTPTHAFPNIRPLQNKSGYLYYKNYVVQ